MTGICLAAIMAAALQGCASSGTVAASGGPIGSTSPTTATARVNSTSSTPTAAPSSAAILTSAAPSTSVALPTSSGSWTPQGDLTNAVPIDTVVNPDKSVTVTYPKGAPAAHALTIKLKATRAAGKLVVHFHADNQSGQQISLMFGLFGDMTAVDAQGTTLGQEPMDPAWTLRDSGDAKGDLVPNQPMNGDIVLDAPASGSTFNLFSSRAIGMGGVLSGVILIRDIPIG